MDKWYFYKRNHWEIWVNAVNRKDADHCISARARGAKFIGEFEPPRGETTATAMVTAKRQKQMRPMEYD